MEISMETKQAIRSHAGEYVIENATFIENVGYSVQWNGNRYTCDDTGDLADKIAELMGENETFVKAITLTPDMAVAEHRSIRVVAKTLESLVKVIQAAELIEALGLTNDFYVSEGERHVDFTFDEDAMFQQVLELICDSETSAFANCTVMKRRGQ